MLSIAEAAHDKDVSGLAEYREVVRQAGIITTEIFQAAGKSAPSRRTDHARHVQYGVSCP